MSEGRSSSLERAPVVGRADELRELAGALDRVPAGFRGWVLAGEAGVGKTTLLRAAIDDARRRGWRVLLARATEWEQALDFAGLGDLLDDVPDEAFEALPSPQRRALDIALRRADDDAPADTLALSQAVLALIRRSAASDPVLLALDDAQWLDAPSARVLEFVVRRLEGEPVALVATVRSTDPRAADPPVLRAVPHERLEHRSVGPLSVDALARLLGERLGHVPPRTVAVRIRELSGGNPFYALELGRAALAQGTQSLDGTLDVPESLSALTRERIRRLPGAARDAVAIAGLALQPTRSLVVAVWPDGPGTGAGMGAGSARDADIAGAALDTAIAAGIVEERADGRLAFTHPLLAWAAASTPTAERREAIHERLAVVAPDPDERVRHLAIVTPFASETVAEAMHAAALRAHDRGAPETATDLELDAVRLTPADLEDRGHQRTMTAAEYAIRAGDPPRARRILERHIERLPAGPPRARAITLLADIRSGDDWEAKLALLDQAREEAGDDHASRAEIEVAAGLGEWMLVRNLPRGVARIRDGLAAARRSGDPLLEVRAAGALAFLEAHVGLLEEGLARIERTYPLAERTPGIRALFSLDYNHALLLDRADRPAEARQHYLAVLERVDRTNDADTRPFVLINLAQQELTLGDWEASRRLHDEADLAADLLGHDSTKVFVSASRAWLDAHRGDVEAVRIGAARAIDLAHRTRSRSGEADGRAALALAELSLGDHDAAWELITPAAAWQQEAGVPHSPGLVYIPLAAETAALRGAPDVDRWLRPLREVGERLDHASSLLAFHRASAQRAAQRGDLEGALASSRLALEQAGRLVHPFALARTRLVHGEILRRLRQRAAAREMVGEALATFERLGAARWTDRARTELARAGLPSGDAAGLSALTPTQREVAALVAAGRTNREVAATLFMSPHTVEAHLTSIYRVLGSAAGPISPGSSRGVRKHRTRGSRDIARGWRRAG